MSLRKFVLLHQEFLPKKYEKVEKLIKKIESLSGVYNDKALSESKTLKLYNPWLMTIITMPLAYILRVLKILVCLIVLLYFFKIVDFFFDANIVKEATIYISKINNLDLCVYFILFYIMDHGNGHIQSLIFASILVITGFQTCIFGILADLLAINRKLSEDIQIRIKRLESK